MVSSAGTGRFQRVIVWPAIVLGLCAIIFGIHRMALLEPDEGRNAEVAREMREAGEWITPHFHGLPYLDKPALYFDAVGLSCALFGRSEAACRLPSVFFAVGTALATFFLGVCLLDRKKALFGVAVLMTSPLFVGFARIVIFDMALTCFVTLALLFAEEGRRGRRWGFPLSWAATALAVLTKGPIGLLLPILGTVALFLGQGPPRVLRKYFHPLHMALFFAVTLPWVFAVEARNPGFLRYALLVETFERLTRPTFHRTGSIHYYLPVLLLGLFPWSLAALGRMPAWFLAVRRLGSPSPERGLILAAGVIVLFFSLSSSKLGGYILPAFPLLALLIGAEAARAQEHPVAWVWVPGIVLLVLGLLLSFDATRIAAACRLHQPQALSGAIETLFVRIGAISLLIGVLLVGLALARRISPSFLFVSLWLPAVVMSGLGPALLYTEENSSRRLAGELRTLGGNNVRVAAVRCFPLSLDYYMGRVVPVVTRTGEEITSNYLVRNFEELRRSGTPGIWSPEELESRLARSEVDILITRGDINLGTGFRLAGRVGGYRLWRQAADHALSSVVRGGCAAVSGFQEDFPAPSYLLSSPEN